MFLTTTPEAVIIILITFIPVILFLQTLQDTIKEISNENRAIQPTQVWLYIIPLFDYIWQFFMFKKISQSLAAEFIKRNIKDQDEKPLYYLGLQFSISRCSIIPVFLFIGAGLGLLFGLVSFVIFIIYWVKINKYKNLLKVK